MAVVHLALVVAKGDWAGSGGKWERLLMDM